MADHAGHHGIVPIAHKRPEKPHWQDVNSLNNIHVEQPEKQCAQDHAAHDTMNPFGVLQDDPPHDQFLMDRCQQDHCQHSDKRIASQHQLHIFLQHLRRARKQQANPDLKQGRHGKARHTSHNQEKNTPSTLQRRPHGLIAARLLSLRTYPK